MAVETVSLTIEKAYRQFYCCVVGWVRRFGVETSDSADVAHEVFVVLRRSHDLPQCDAGMRAWLYVVSRRAAKDYRQKMRRGRMVSMNGMSEQVMSGCENSLAEREYLMTLETCSKRLSAPQREVFQRYALEEMGIRDIAERLNIPLQTAYSRLYEAQRLLQQFVAQAALN